MANLTVTWWGPSVAIINAFLFIGLDLTARDYLHEAWRGDRLALKMAGLIATGSALSYLLNRNAGQIALASFVAFAAAAIVDTLVYHRLRHLPMWARMNGSNIPSAAVDSIVFPALAFGFPLMFGIMAGQFIAKVAGGAIWSVILTRGKKK